jgi:GNAT superfamily N-acetyltransferase
MPAIRKAVHGDIDDVFALAQNLATSFQPDRARFKAAFEYSMTQDDAVLLVAEDAAALVGYLLGFEDFTFFAGGRVARVEEVFVRETARKQGHGRRLMAEFEQWSKSRGSVMVTLATRRAGPFYKAIGYSASATYFRKML